MQRDHEDPCAVGSSPAVIARTRAEIDESAERLEEAFEEAVPLKSICRSVAQCASGSRDDPGGLERILGG